MKRILTISLSLFIVLISTQLVSAKFVGNKKAFKAAKTFLTLRYPTSDPNLVKTKTKKGKSAFKIKNTKPLEVEGKIVGYLNSLEPSGFILFSADDEAPPIKIYSSTGKYENLPNGLRNIIELELLEDWQILNDKQLKKKIKRLKNFKNSWDTLITDEEFNSVSQFSTENSDTALLSTTWNQDDPYNFYCPNAIGGPGGRAYAGCTATALSQILRYHSHPTLVTSDHTYTDDFGNCQGTFSISDVGMEFYDWANMPTSISSSSPTAQIEAISRLLYHCGVALESNYESDGTSAFPSSIPNVLDTYFGYTSGNYLRKSNYTSDNWYIKIENDIDNSRPVFYAMWESDGSSGHAVVCDGYRNGNEIHLDLGWSGSGTAWYNIDSVSFSGYTWTTHGGVFNITPAENNTPILSNPKVSPISGTEQETEFEFSVDYYDPDGDSPIEKNVHLSDGRVVPLTLKSGSASDGTYTYNTDWLSADDSPYSYYFFFTDAQNSSAITQTKTGPYVYSSDSTIELKTEVIGGPVSNNIEIRFGYGPDTQNLQYFDWLGPDLPQYMGINSGQEVMFVANLQSNNHTFVKWEFKDDQGNIIRESTASSYGFTLLSGNLHATAIFEYTPITYNISGTVLKSDGSTIQSGVDLHLFSSEQSISQSTDNGTFSFSGVKGGVSVEITPSATGYTFAPSKLVFNNLKESWTNQTVNGYSSDYSAPETSLVYVPPSFNESSNISFTWEGQDNVSESQNIQYQYKLEGYNTDWTSWNGITNATYDVNNGEYIFQIRAKDEAGNINQVPKKYPFAINAAPKISSIEQIDNSVWASRITLQMPQNSLYTSKKFILPSNNTGLEDEKLVPVTIHNVDDSNPIGANEIIAAKLGINSIIVKTELGWEITLPELINPGQSVQYDIRWGKIKYFGWQKQKDIQDGFPDLTVAEGYTSRIDASWLDDQMNMWRLASKRLNRVDGNWGSTRQWVFMDIANDSGPLIPAQLIEYLPGTPYDGSYACEYDFEQGNVLPFTSRKCVFWNTEKYEKITSGSENDYKSYHRYSIKSFDDSGNIVNSFDSSWQEDTFIDTPSVVFSNTFFITGKTYNHSADTSELWFTKHNSEGQKLQARTVFESVSRDNSGDLDCWGFRKCGNNVAFLFQESHYTDLNHDRRAIYYQVRDLNGNIIKGTTAISPPLLSNTIDKEDEYEIESALTDKNGKVWISFSHDQTGQPYENYYTVIGADGNIWKSNTYLGNEVWRDFVYCDKDGYIWAKEDSNLLILNPDDTQAFDTRLIPFIPSQNIGNKAVNRDWQGKNYKLYDRWSSELMQINVPENYNLSYMDIYDLNLWENDLHAANLTFKLGDTVIWSQIGQFEGEASVVVKDVLSIGQNLLTLSQEDFQGGQILVTFPYSVPTIIGDLNADRTVDFVDLNILTSQWLGTPGNPSADIVRDNEVNFLDFTALAQNWGVDERISEQIIEFPLDSNPNWSCQGEWVFGQPMGGGGLNGNADPANGYTGSNVFGVNLAGDYSTNPGGPYFLITDAIDCSGYSNIHLKFARWLNTDFPPYAYSKVEASNDGVTWHTVWEHSENRAIMDSTWQQIDYDISSIADNQSTVFVRWGYQIGSGAYAYSGWNIDDVELWGLK